MPGPAPVEIEVVHTDDDTAELHSGTQDSLAAIGQAGETVPAQEQPVLKEGLDRLGQDITPGAVEEFLHGTGPTTFVRNTRGENWRTRLRQRILGKWKSIRHKK